jgi:hypothetical protein
VVANGQTGSSSELDEIVHGTRVDAGGFVGTYDVTDSPSAGGDDAGTSPREFARFIFLLDGTALACPHVSEGPGRTVCRPADGPAGSTAASPSLVPRRPYEVVQVGQSERRALVIHTSAADKSPFRVYAIDRPLDALGAASLREVRADGKRPAFDVHRLACSETLYQDQDADHACAYYQCKIDSARSAADRCSYFTEFGLPYCNKFYGVAFDDHVFGPSTRECLQEVIRDKMAGAACDVVEEAAIASHVDCYVESGFCSLSPTDKLKVIETIEAKDFTPANGLTLAKIEERCRTYVADAP